MSGNETRQFGVQDLVRATGIARRTIRYYVQRELLPPPRGAGRGHYYVAEHLERLQRIRELQDQGLTLEEIRVVLESGAESGESRTADVLESAALEIDTVTRIRVADGVELLVSGDSTPPTPAQVRALARAAMDILGRKPVRDRRQS